MSSTITLKDQKYLKDQFAKLGFCLSEYSFANCYLFREVHQYEIKGNFLKGVSRDGFVFHMPLSYPFDVNIHDQFYPIPEKWLHLFPGEEFERQALAGDADYIFSKEKMILYPGRSLAGQRNFVRQFTSQYLQESVPRENCFSKEGSRQILDAWAASQDSKNDYKSCLEAIDNFEELNLMGYSVCSNQEPLGFIIAERQLPHMVDIHFAKSKPNIKGLYPYIYQAFCKTLPEEVKWINLEQDLGLPGLAKAKSSYQPDKLLPKYRVSRKK